MWVWLLCDKIDFVLRTIQNISAIVVRYFFCMNDTKNYENYKILVQKWERQTNKQTKQSTG